MPTLNLTQEQYNQLIEYVKPNEELTNILKTNENENTNSNNTISIRTLSNNEFDKYIKTATLDGSISAMNISVWNYDNKPNTYSACGAGQSNPGYSQDPSITYAINYVDTGNYLHHARYTIEMYGELSSQNQNEQFKYSIIRNILLKCYSSCSQGSYLSSGSIATKSVTQYANKTLNVSAEIAQAYARGKWGDYYTIVTANVNLSFRPVFNYVDNNKSIDIFK